MRLRHRTVPIQLKPVTYGQFFIIPKILNILRNHLNGAVLWDRGSIICEVEVIQGVIAAFSPVLMGVPTSVRYYDRTLAHWWAMKRSGHVAHIVSGKTPSLTTILTKYHTLEKQRIATPMINSTCYTRCRHHDQRHGKVQKPVQLATLPAWRWPWCLCSFPIFVKNLNTAFWGCLSLTKEFKEAIYFVYSWFVFLSPTVRRRTHSKVRPLIGWAAMIPASWLVFRDVSTVCTGLTQKCAKLVSGTRTVALVD